MIKRILSVFLICVMFPAIALTETYFVFSNQNEPVDEPDEPIVEPTEFDVAKSEEFIKAVFNKGLKSEVISSITEMGFTEAESSWLSSTNGWAKYQGGTFFGIQPGMFKVSYSAGMVKKAEIEFVGSAEALRNSLNSIGTKKNSGNEWTINGYPVELASINGKHTLYLMETMPLPDETGIYNIKVTSAKKVPEGQLMFQEGWQVGIMNKTGKTIDVLDVRMRFENAYREPMASITTEYYDVTIDDIKLNDNAAYSNKNTSEYLPYPAIGFEVAKYIYFTVCKYHTTEGETVVIPEHEYKWLEVIR